MEMEKSLVESSDLESMKRKTFVEKIAFQIRLLMWKRYAESTKSRWDLLKVLLPAILFFVLLILLYAVFNDFADDGLEPFVVPFAFWIFMQRLVVHIMYEKSTKLQESMRMMGLSDFAYWTSYFITDGVILGFVMSFLCCLLTVGGLFNSANFGVLLGIFLVFCLSAVPFCFFICCFFDTPQTAGQALLALLFGLYVAYVVLFPVESYTTSLEVAQTWCCFVPPLALQIASGAFLKSYTGISVSKICSIMVADIFIYSAAAWYFAQVWPSKVGVRKPWYFPVMPSYWFPLASARIAENEVVHAAHLESGVDEEVVQEVVNESILGRPTVSIRKLCKTFGTQRAVNQLSFDMYENQIFALLGHNGAGKTTTISMLTGLISPDYLSASSGATVYGHDVLTEMDQIRYSMGVCPQHDVLFENLTVREHILFFAQLKGYSIEKAEEEARQLTELFHLDSRLDHTGSELSGGQKRKLSVAIAVCGGSQLVVLDEPSAGMDPLARRELWDLLVTLRKGRTMLLTTHYMDEADILGDRVGIMSLGQMQCVGTTQFLKTRYGAGYKLIFDKKDGAMHADQLHALTDFVKKHIPEAKYIEEDGADEQVLYSLPFHTVASFGPFFTELESRLHTLGVSNFGVTITSLEDVFLKVGEDHTVTPQATSAGDYGIGKDRGYQSNLTSQIIGLAKRKLTYCLNDLVTIPLLLFPIAAGIAAAVLYQQRVITSDDDINDLITAGMYVGAYLGAPGLIAEFIVRERADKLRNVLTVMGCDFRAYWIGTFIADYCIMLIPTVVLWITWPAAVMTDFYSDKGALCFFLLLLFNVHMIAFSYFFSNVFTSPKSCISLMPIIILVLVITPNIVLLIMIEIVQACGSGISSQVQGGILLWGTMLLTPHGALFTAILDSTGNYSNFLSSFPPVGATITFMVVESAAYLAYAYFNDAQSISKLEPTTDPSFDPRCLEVLDEDVKAERERTAQAVQEPLRIDRLRKVFPPKRVGQRPVVATEDVAFHVQSGEIFGLLGANGAGKTTTLSMLTRHLVPTSGDAFITQHSILSEFSQGATQLGVVTQNNSLWDRLSVEAHLKLFARLRGVPEDLVSKVVDGTIDQLELTPHRKKLAMSLSGGMKRKLCVAIALIGDPAVCLLDEPSAGLDPVSRRNLWSVILRTMSMRSVILTTHSMDEAEALCKRIGIMVKGQLRALGTKQHLKVKFGSGFELTVKLLVDNKELEEFVKALTLFVQKLFPSASMLSENGGLLTYQIPREEMRMGLAFTQLEQHKQSLRVEDYTIAQPTLEQVFIRTVNKYSDVQEKRAGAPTVLGGSARMSVEGTALLEGEGEDGARRSSLFQDVFGGDIVLEVNKCGCTNFFVKILIAVFALLTVVFLGTGIGVSVVSPNAAGVLITVSIIFLIASVFSCFVLYCACCQYPKGADE